MWIFPFFPLFLRRNTRQFDLGVAFACTAGQPTGQGYHMAGYLEKYTAVFIAFRLRVQQQKVGFQLLQCTLASFRARIRAYDYICTYTAATRNKPNVVLRWRP